MTLYEFNILPLNKRAEYVWRNGTFLANRATEDFKINLYSIGVFFAEVWYVVEDNSIESVKSFSSKAPLEPYIDLIKIEF